MITAEALASIDIAPILAFIFLRSRSTRERLPSASDRLPPAWPWMAMTIAKKLVSATGTRCAMRSTASGSVRPIVVACTTLRNSPRTGSALSLAAIRMVSPSGRPDLTPRTMMSMRVREVGDELRNSALPQAIQSRLRQARPADHRDERREEGAAGLDPRHEADGDASDKASGQELRRRRREARLLDAALERDAPAARFLEIAQAVGDLLAALGLIGQRRGRRRTPAAHAADRRAPLVRARLAADDHERKAAHRHGEAAREKEGVDHGRRLGAGPQAPSPRSGEGGAKRRMGCGKQVWSDQGLRSRARNRTWAEAAGHTPSGLRPPSPASWGRGTLLSPIRIIFPPPRSRRAPRRGVAPR